MIAALSFLTCLGTGRAPDGRTSRWFGVVGAALGALLGLAWVALDHLVASALSAALVLALDAALTGMLHFDGLADSGDGLFAHMTRDRRLEVMSAPDVGAFGVVTVLLVVLVRFGALVSLRPSLWLLVAVWSATRAAVAFAMTVVPYARATGIASSFGASNTQAATRLSAAASIVVAAALVLVWHANSGGLVVLAALLASAAVIGFGRRRLGGYTGDVLGAAIVVGETVGLVVASAIAVGR